MTHFDECHRRKIFLEDVFRHFLKLGRVAQIGKKYAHGYDIVEIAAGLGEGIGDLFEYRFKLGIEIAQIRIGTRLACSMTGKEIAWCRLSP